VALLWLDDALRAVLDFIVVGGPSSSISACGWQSAISRSPMNRACWVHGIAASDVKHRIVSASVGHALSRTCMAWSINMADTDETSLESRMEQLSIPDETEVQCLAHLADAPAADPSAFVDPTLPVAWYHPYQHFQPANMDVPAYPPVFLFDPPFTQNAMHAQNSSWFTMSRQHCQGNPYNQHLSAPWSAFKGPQRASRPERRSYPPAFRQSSPGSQIPRKCVNRLVLPLPHNAPLSTAFRSVNATIEADEEVADVHPFEPSWRHGPPRNPQQSGHGLWVGNLPSCTNVLMLKDHLFIRRTGHHTKCVPDLKEQMRLCQLSYQRC